MQKRKQILAAWAAKTLLVLSTVLGSTAAVGAERTVTISTGEWAPFVSESLQGYGIAPRIVTAAFGKVDVDVEYVFYPWARAMREAQEKKVDFSGFWFHTEERAKTLTYTESMVDSPNVFFYRKDRKFDWSDFNNFPDKTIGTTLSYSYSQAFDDAVNTGKVSAEVEETDLLNFRKLLRGRIDAFPIAELVGYDLIKREFSASEVAMLDVHPVKISAAPLHLITARDNPEAEAKMALFSEGLKQLRESGELDRILSEYK